MGRWDTISDPSNPFNKEGLSDEVKAMLDYLVVAKEATGIDVVATSTTDHPLYSAAGSVSRHRQKGTNGEGLGLDCRLRRRGNNIHGPVWGLWLPVARRCHELIYAQGVDEQGRPRNIKNELWVSRYAITTHYDHVHVSVDRGVFLKYPANSQNGSTGGLVVNVAKRAQGGYALVGPDGGVFCKDGAPFFGSLPGINHKPPKPVVGMAWTLDGGGYWLVSADGSVYAFGNAPSRGSYWSLDPIHHNDPNRTFVGIVALDNGLYSIIGYKQEHYDF